MPVRATLTEPVEVVMPSAPEIAPVAVVGDGRKVTLMVQLLMAGRLVPQVVAAMKNAGTDTVGRLSVIAVVPELVIVTACGSDSVPCAVAGKVSEVGETSGAAAVMVMVNGWLAVPAALVALTVPLNVPAAVGDPLNTPLVLLILRPVGSMPVVSVQVIGVLPVAAEVWL